MRNFQDTFETRKRSCISGFSICMTLSYSGQGKTDEGQTNEQNKIQNKIFQIQQLKKKTKFLKNKLNNKKL